jgi:N-acetyl-anhydromuramyl-L-alanine amidase AmpD
MTDGNSIIIMGERFPLGGGIKVVTYADPIEGPKWTFYRTGGGGSDLVRELTSERVLSGKPVRTLEDLQKCVHQAVLHSDCMSNAQGCYTVLIDRGLSTHFMLDWDGTIYQGADVLHRTYHAGDANNHSIGMDLNNRLPLRRPGEPPLRPYVGECLGYFGPGGPPPGFTEQERQESEMMVINGTPKQSYGYTDEQYKALVALLRVLADRLPLMRTRDEENGVPQPPMDETGQVLNKAMDGATTWRGIIAHWHITAMKWDPGPGFDWQRVYHELRGEDNHFPVQLAAEDKRYFNASTMEGEAALFYENNYRGMSGYYPVGINLAWHGGIHLNLPRGTPVKAMLSGTLVAARIAPPVALGSHSFVLLRHVIEMPKADDGTESVTKLRMYSLYMHLDPIALEQPQESWPRWLVDAHRLSLSRRREEDEAPPKPAPKPKAKPTGDKAKPEDDAAVAQAPTSTASHQDRSPYSKIESGGFHTLQAGRVALFDWKTESAIRVSSGDVLGSVGVFGDRFTPESLVHIEFFTDENWRSAVDLAVHARHWFVLDDPIAGALRVSNGSVLRLMGAQENPPLAQGDFLFPDRALNPGSVRTFYQSPAYAEARDYLRRAIVRFTSEWSDQVDWVKALSEAQDWQGKTQDLDRLLRSEEGGRLRTGVFSKDINDILPFIWLTEDVAKHIGLEVNPWNGMVYHFHPIHMLVWLSFYSSSRVRVLAKGGKTRKELEAAMAQERLRMEEARERLDLGLSLGDNAEEFLEGSTEVDLAQEFPNPLEALESLRDVGRPGQVWKRVGQEEQGTP